MVRSNTDRETDHDCIDLCYCWFDFWIWICNAYHYWSDLLVCNTAINTQTRQIIIANILNINYAVSVIVLLYSGDICFKGRSVPGISRMHNGMRRFLYGWSTATRISTQLALPVVLFRWVQIQVHATTCQIDAPNGPTNNLSIPW